MKECVLRARHLRHRGEKRLILLMKEVGPIGTTVAGDNGLTEQREGGGPMA